MAATNVAYKNTDNVTDQAVSVAFPLPVTLTSGSTNQNVNVAQVGGATASTAASGVLKVGVVGNTGATLDAALTAGTAPTNGVALIGQFLTTPPTLTTGQTAGLQTESDGTLRVSPTLAAIGGLDAAGNALVGFFNQTTTHSSTFPAIAPSLFNGTTWDRARTAGIGNNVAATGISASGGYGQYLNNANQASVSTGNYGSLQTDPAGNLRTAPQRPVSGDILVGYQTFTSTTSATTLITVPQGRTWVGTISANCTAQEVAAGTVAAQARAVFTTAGTNVTPAAGTYFAVEAKVGGNAASGLVGTQAANFGSTPFIVVAPAGNSVTIQVASTNAGTASVVDASAIGVLQ